MTHFIVGYGTLLLKASLGSSVGQESAGAKNYLPVMVKGFRRLFNLRPDHYESTTKLSHGGIERAALNVEADSSSQLNAVAFRVTEDELAILDRRERYYSRVPVHIVAFGTEEVMGIAHIYSAPLDAPSIVRDTRLLMPSWRDVVFSRVGAYQISEKFGRCFDETTFLADGRMLMIDVYGEYLKDISDVQIPG